MASELFYTERAHVRTLKVLDNVFYQKLTLDSILPPADIKNIFSNLEEIIQLHGTKHTCYMSTFIHPPYLFSLLFPCNLLHFPSVMISEQMAAIRKRNETSVVDKIGDDLLSWVSARFLQGVERSVTRFQCGICPVKPCLNSLSSSAERRRKR